jgi:hypothetical protein
MDDTHFDALTRSLAGPSRRSLFAAIMTAIGATLFGDEGADDVLARTKRTKRQQAKQHRRNASRDQFAADGRKKRKKKKKKKKGARPGTTVPPTVPPAGGCTSGGCPGGQVCQTGQCVSSCDAGFTPCGGQCVNTQTNPGHCGGCNQLCAVQAPETCGTTGQCAGGVCQTYETGTVCVAPRCTSATSARRGECFNGICGSTIFYVCTGYCDAATGTCQPCTADGQCGSDKRCDLDSGRCLEANGRPCGSPTYCASGICVDNVCCDSACDAPAPPNAHRTCATGTCALACNPGFGNCDGAWANGCEADLNTSEQHCGGCNQPCGGENATGNCTNGTCTLICDTGWDDCDGDLANGCEADLTLPAHCGSCSNVCTGPCDVTWECINDQCHCI